MTRYFTIRHPQQPRSEDDWWPTGNSWHIPTVCDHHATNTGLLDADGNTIWRAPEPMGFQWRDE